MSVTADTTIHFQAGKVYSDGRDATLSISVLKSSGAGLQWSGGLQSVLEYWAQGEVELRLDYDGTAKPVFTFYGGGQPGPTVRSLGRREETVERVIQFGGDQTHEFSEPGVTEIPEILFTTDFIDVDGNPVTPARFRKVDGKIEAYTSKVAWGSILIRFTMSYHVYRLNYNVNDRIINGDIVNWEEIPDMRVFVRAGFAIANTNVSRAVQWPKSGFIQERPAKEYKKQELARHGKVYRIFPPTEPDPETGTTNYYDQEVVTRIVYGYFETDEDGDPVIRRDQFGRVINAEKFLVERFTGLQPPGSREIRPFVHGTEVETV